MSEKKIGESQKQQGKQRKPVVEAGLDLDQSQSVQDLAAMQAAGFPNLPDHPTTKRVRQAAVLQMQRRLGNRFSVQQLAGYRNTLAAPRNGLTPAIQREEVSAASVYERISGDAVFETLAHEMVYEDELSRDQRQTLRELGFRPRPLVTDPVSDFQMRGFIPLDNEAGSGRTPVLAFRGSESIQDVIDDLNERGIGALQMRRNLNSIMDEMEQLGGRVVVTGHSLGGALAQMSAALFPSRVVRVVTFQSPGIPSAMLDQLRLYNETVPEDQRIQSDHYQAEGGIIDAAGQAFTPGSITVLPTDLVSLGSVIGGIIGSPAGPVGAAGGFAGGRAISAHTTFIIRRLQELRRDDPDEFRELMLEVHQVNNGDSRPIESIRSTLGVDRSD